MNCWRQSYILSLWTQEKGGSGGTEEGTVERSKGQPLSKKQHDSGNANVLDSHVDPNEIILSTEAKICLLGKRIASYKFCLVTNPVAFQNRNMSIFRAQKERWKHIRTLNGNGKEMELHSFGNGKGYNSAVECHLDVVEVISSSLIIPKPNGWLYFWERTPGEYEAHGYKLGLGMKDNSESALSTNKEAITTLGLRHGPDSYGRQQWGIFRNGRKPDGAMPRGAAVIQRMQALSGMIGRKASVGGFLSPPSNPRAQLWTGGGNYQAGVRGANGIRYPSSPSRKRWILGAVRIDPCSAVANALSIPPGETLPGLDMPRILLKERGAFGNADTGGAWLSSARATAGDKPEEGEDDVKSSCPLCPGRHTCYNGRDKGSRSREGELTPKTRPQFGLQAATRLHEAGIASNRRRYLNRKEGDAEGRASDWSEVVTRALSHMDSSMCSSAPDPEMWIIQGTLAWRTPPVRTGKAEIKWDVSIYLSLDSKWEQSYFTKTCHGKEEGGNRHTWRAQYNGELYAAFGKDESLPKRNLLILSQLDGPAAPGKRIEEASDSFMHAPLGSGGYSSVGRAPLLQLGRCDYGLDV
ncbi:hypothetical protein Tco_0841689 [Tanacetum coccineum]|uniref:Uncharacterized protein ycf68 n=1 Tax=Tanacetum coccineum TaxID=301880 RepID=A0ABQ5B0K9_9ASTR